MVELLTYIHNHTSPYQVWHLSRIAIETMHPHHLQSQLENLVNQVSHWENRFMLLLPNWQPTSKHCKNYKHWPVSLFIVRLLWSLLLLAVISRWEDAMKLRQFQPWQVPHWRLAMLVFAFVFDFVFVSVFVFVLLRWIQPWQALHLRFRHPGPCQTMQMCPWCARLS